MSSTTAFTMLLQLHWQQGAMRLMSASLSVNVCLIVKECLRHPPHHKIVDWHHKAPAPPFHEATAALSNSHLQMLLLLYVQAACQ
jgi:hypothetical protein